MTLKPCVQCGEPSDQSRCPAHQPRCTKPSSRTRGYDTAWTNLSRRARRLQPWCSDCGATEDLQCDHTPEAWAAHDAGKPIKLTMIDVVCGPCNRRRGAARGGHPQPDPPAPGWHRMLLRCKVAAALAILHRRLEITELDWQLAAEVMAVSDRTRDWIVAEAQNAARAKVRDRAVARAVGEAIYDDRVLEAVKRSLLRMLERDGEQAGNELRSRLGRREKRDLFDQAIKLLEHEDLVERVEVGRGTRFRIASGQGDHPGQGQYSQVREGDHLGQGDHPATVTDLDSRRSHDPLLVKPSARIWLDHHIATLRGEGHETVKAFAVYEAGKAAGYTRSNIAQAASAHPDITVVDKSGGVSTWSLTGEHREYVTAAEWVDKYLDRLPDGTIEVDQFAIRHTGIAAGYTWPAVRNAALRSGRIDSVPAHGNARAERIWHLTEPITSTEGEQPA